MSDLVTVSTAQAPAVLNDIEARLADYARRADGAFSPNTARAIQSDTRIFNDWCAARAVSSLPAEPSTVAEFVEHQAADKAPATISRYCASIAHMHRAANVADPTKAESVRLALRKIRRTKTTRQKQAAPITDGIMHRLAAVLTDSRQDVRDFAMLAVARDAMLRRSELVAITVDDIAENEDGTGSVLVRKSKTDQEGAGAFQFLSASTMEAVQRYIAANDITEGFLFRRFIKGGGMGDSLSTDSVAKTFKRLAALAGVDAENISGHSARVGMAQDLTAAGADLPAIMQAGRWKSATMPARYGERLAVRRGAVARFYDSR